jgi:DNA-binding response OmpR family regulator
MATNLEGCSVLLVDDDQDILTTLRMAFDRCGAKVSTATDGNKGLDMARRLAPDLIILDMMMPKKSGFLVMETLISDQRPDAKRPRVIMITANEGKRHEFYARHLGVDDYVSKPFSTERILESAAGLLGREYEDPFNSQL